MHARGLVVVSLLAGCGNPISNALFLEDAEFLAAIPSFDSHGVEFPYEPTDQGEDLDLRNQSATAAANLEATLTDLMALGDFIRHDEPSLREDNLRSWGPSSLENGSRSLLLVDIVRSGVGQYDWAFMLSESSAGPWEPFYHGTHYSGATVAAGDGTFEAEIGLLSSALGEEREGRVRVDYDLREGTRWRLDLLDYRDSVSAEPFDACYAYESDGGGGGDFQHGYQADLAEGAALERLGVRTRWKAGGAMRADARIEGGDLLGEVLTASQCWDAAGELVFQEDSWGLTEPLGGESACAFGKPLYVEDW